MVVATTERAHDGTLSDVGDLDRAALERLGIRYELHDALPLEDLDDAASRAVWNQARLGDPVDEEHVEQLLAELVERGAEFPPIIFYQDESGKKATLSGNHRRRVHELAERPTIRAYEANGLNGLRKEDERVLRLIYEANHGHGKAVAGDDRIRQAIALIENGYTVRAASSAVGMPENRVRDKFEISRATRRLEDQDVETTKIHISNQRRLVNIKNDTVLKEAAKLVPLMDKQTEEVNELVKAVNAERTQEAQLAVVQDYDAMLRRRERPDGNPRDRRPEGVTADVRRFDTAMGAIMRFDVETLRSGIPADFRDRLVERVHEAAAKLTAAKAVL